LSFFAQKDLFKIFSFNKSIITTSIPQKVIARSIEHNSSQTKLSFGTKSSASQYRLKKTYCSI